MAQPAAGPSSDRPLRIPEKPRLAPDVELKGQMDESAFEDPPWLVERDGSYVQLPELLYAVAEQSDGRRGYPEIAAGVTQRVNRPVSAENVRQLLGKLVVLGIVPAADGRVVRQQRGERSPLAVNMRMAMLSPRLIEPLTGLLRVLFWPPILFAALAATAAAHVWLYFLHGVGAALRDAFYTPGNMLAVAGLVVFSAAFHEFGHASALRYGGGRVKGMGAGFYLAFPAFYTDVTDNYRLPRWSRIRTDLGGFYFNLLFALGLVVAYVVTGYEPLLLAAVVSDIEIIHQLLPFVRLDGYWALADLTGIPDFFSRVVPFLRGLLSNWLPLREGPAMPALKPWARVFFGGYILLAVPFVALLLLLLIKAAPRVVATAWDAGGQQMGHLGGAFGSADWALAAMALAQIALLALPVIGLLSLLWTLGRRAIKALWGWSGTNPARRALAAMATAAGVLGVVLLWLPEIPFTGTPSPLRGTVRFEPVVQGERFTFGEVISPVRPLQRPGAPSPSPLPSPSPSPFPSPSPSPTDGESSPTAAPTATPTQTTSPLPTPTPSPTGTP